MNRKVDVLILGGGIAGTCLAWTLLERGRSFCLIDDNAPASASRVAAGLVTPITGRRVNATYNWLTAFPLSDRFYQQVEQRLGATFWFRSGAARLCDEATSPKDIKDRLKQFPDIETVWLEPDWLDDNLLQNCGGFFMPQATRLDVNHFLSMSHAFFKTQDSAIHSSVDLDEDVFVYPKNVFYRPENISASYVICCRGVADRDHRLFQKARFNPAQGDILSIRLAKPVDTVTLHSNWWMTPATASRSVGSLSLSTRPKSNDWLLGSTYQWRPLDGLPSPEGRDSLLEGLSRRFNMSCEVIDHRAAIRPSTFDQKPLLGMHNELPRLGILNGLGAKGCYLAPWCASMLVDAMFEGTSIPYELKWDR